jgi:hypothetical protein
MSVQLSLHNHLYTNDDSLVDDLLGKTLSQTVDDLCPRLKNNRNFSGNRKVITGSF